MSKEAADQLRAAMAERHRRKSEAIDEMQGWLEEWLVSLDDHQFWYLHRHFEVITNLGDKL